MALKFKYVAAISALLTDLSTLSSLKAVTKYLNAMRGRYILQKKKDKLKKQSNGLFTFWSNNRSC